MANVIKKAVFGLIEKAILQEGLVTSIRKWEGDAMVEIDLHLPSVDMSKWHTIQRLKCKVNDFEFRDYTPAHWDVEKRTCTMFVETGHNGDGARWANTLKVGDSIYFGPAHAAQLPSTPGKVLCIADGSALGHFMALKQLLDPQKYSMEVLVVLSEEHFVPDDVLIKYPAFEWIKAAPDDSFERLSNQLEIKSMQNYSSIFIAGNMRLVSSLRKFLKKNPYLTARVVAHGFWK